MEHFFFVSDMTKRLLVYSALGSTMTIAVPEDPVRATQGRLEGKNLQTSSFNLLQSIITKS